MYARYSGPVGNSGNAAAVMPLMRGKASSTESKCVDCTMNGPCERAVCSIAPEIVIQEPPQSPDYESDRECWSDSSDYQPIVSPVSPADRKFEATPGASTSQNNDYEMGPSKAQQFWSRKIRRGRRGPMVKRVASVRPRASWVRPAAIQGLLDPRRFRVTMQHPILQTRAIVDRSIAVDGTVLERAVHDQFVMSRTVATQTLMNSNDAPMEGSNMCQSTQTVRNVENTRSQSTQTLDPEDSSLSMVPVRRSMTTQTAMSYVLSLQNESTDEEWEIVSDDTSCENNRSGNDNDVSSDDDTIEESDDSSHVSDHDCEGSESDTDGTPVQDENDSE
jgi:hypothetical protein